MLLVSGVQQSESVHIYIYMYMYMYIYMEEMAIHCTSLAWRLRWTEEPSGLQSMGVTELDTTKQLSTHTHIYLCITIGILITIRKVVENMRLPKYHSV